MLNLSSVPPPETLATYRDIRRLLGNTQSMLEILSMFPSVADLVEAQAWLEGQGDIVARPQTTKIAAILDIVNEDEADQTRLSPE